MLLISSHMQRKTLIRLLQVRKAIAWTATAGAVMIAHMTAGHTMTMDQAAIIPEEDAAQVPSVTLWGVILAAVMQWTTTGIN